MSGPRTRADGVQQVPAAPIEQQRPAVHESLVFENAPVCLWHEDFSGVKQQIESLSQDGIEDFRKYFENHADVVAECARLVTVLDVNRAAVKLHHAGSKKELTDSLRRRFSEESYEVFREELIALANGETSFDLDAAGLTLDGERIDVILRMFVDPNSPNWSSVYVALTDITERKRAERVSQEKEVHLDNLLSNVDAIILEGDPFNIYYVGGQVERILGYPKDMWFEHPGGPVGFWSGLLHPDDLDKIEICRQAIERGEDHSFEYRLIAKDGKPIWFYDSVMVETRDGKPVKTRSVMIDITERKRAEKELQLMQFAIDHSSDPIFWVKADGGIAYANQAACRSLGYGAEELLSLSVSDFDPDFPRHVWPEHWEQMKESGTATFETHHRTKQGRVFPVEIATNYLEHEGREYIWAYARDITERKRAEEKTAYFNRVLEHSLNEIYIFDAETLHFVDVNRGARQNLGYSMDELRGLTPLDLKPEFTTESFTELIEPVRKGEQELLQFTTVHRRKDETLYPVEVYLQLVSGDTPVFVVIILDITERKRAEEEKRKLQDHLRHAQKMDAVGQLAAGVAHEFNNILVGILGNAELLLAASGDDLPERFKRPLKDIERSGTRAADLTKQLLSFTRKKNPNGSLLDVNQVISGSKGMLQRLVGKRITLKIVLAPDPALVHADEAKIEQAILNLVMNACDAMPDGGTLAIRTDFTMLEANEVAPDCKPGRYVRLSVIDEGCGMPPETAERIFEPFFTTKPVGKGTGLGLSTVFADVSNSGGFVTAESRVGKGTAICVHLPQAKGAIETTGAGAEHVRRPVGGNETILVCDDEEVVLASVSKLLQTLGYPVLSANSPQEAIEVAGAYDGPISLLLTDVTMPGMDGIELGKEIMRFYPDIRVILTSGYAEDVLRGRAVEDEHFGFLQKPVPYDVLARTIREILD